MHLMLYHDGQFAKHPCIRYFALNTEMRYRALQAGRIYVCQHPHNAHLTLRYGWQGRKGFVQQLGFSIFSQAYMGHANTGSSRVAS